MFCSPNPLYILVVPYKPHHSPGFLEGFLVGIHDLFNGTKFSPPPDTVLRLLGQKLYNVSLGRGNVRIIAPEEMRDHIALGLREECQFVKVGNFRNQLARYLACACRTCLRGCCHEPEVIYLGIDQAYKETCDRGDTYGWKILKSDSVKIEAEKETWEAVF